MIDAQGKPLQSQPANLELSCQVEYAEAELVMSFQLSNQTKAPVYVFDNGARGDFLPDAVSAGADEAVHVLYGVPELPPFPTYWKYHPKTTMVAAGSVLRRVARFKLPFREGDPYYPARLGEHSTIDVRRLVLRVDLVRESELTAGATAEDARGRVESTSCAIPLVAGMQLERRSGPFTRF
jgi:hypothetical protein